MSTLRYTDGSVTVTLDEGLEDLVRRALDAAAGATVQVMERAAEKVAAQARADWYAADTGVTRQTGSSGDVRVVTTVTPDEVRVSVGSADLTKARYVHRPGPLSTVAEEISEADYYAAKRAGGLRASTVFHARQSDAGRGVVAGKYYKRVPNPRAGDGKFLVVELVRRPMTAKVKAITPELGRAIAERAGS